MGNMIKSRLAAIGKRQIDLLPVLAEKGYRVAPSQPPRYIGGWDNTPQAMVVRELVHEILKGWEKATA